MEFLCGRGAEPITNRIEKRREKKQIQPINSAIDLIGGLLFFSIVWEEKKKTINHSTLLFNGAQRADKRRIDWFHLPRSRCCLGRHSAKNNPIHWMSFTSLRSFLSIQFKLACLCFIHYEMFCLIGFHWIAFVFSFFAEHCRQAGHNPPKREKQFNSFHQTAPLQASFTPFILLTGRAALPSTNFFSSARPLGRTSWKEKKCCCWAAAIAQTSLSFNTADAFITIQSSLLY